MDDKSLKDIISLAQRGAPIVTVNARLSRHLGREFDSAMAALGLGAWPTPLILPLPAWAERLWDGCSAGLPLLDPTRSRALWDKMVRDDPAVAGAGALAASAVADSSWAAYSVMKDYRIEWPRDDIYLTEEARALKRVSIAYEDAVRKLGFVDGAALVDRLSSLVKRGGAELPKELAVVGFDELSPRADSFLKALEESGVNVRVIGGIGGNGGGSLAEVRVKACEDESEEAEQAARWARETLALRPGESIAVIVPELARYRELIMREFSAELNPESALVGNGGPEPFNISLGTSLSDEPLVASALGLIAIGEGPVDIDELLCALRSPYLCAPEASMEAARADMLLRKDGRSNASVTDIIKRLDQNTSELRKKCETHLGWLRKSRDRRLPGQWAEAFSSLLSAVGWTKPLKLSSAEFQALGAWKTALASFSTLDDVTGPLSRPEAASLLRKLCADTIHQGESPECSIQVLGLLETAGLSFDHIYLLGCHENALPPAPSPNPFIPLHIQKRHNVPRSSSERELAFTRKVVGRLLSSARSAVVSYPVRSDGRELLLSPLFREFEGAGEAPFIERSSRVKDSMRYSAALEQAPADGPVPVTDEELACLRGGTSIIKDQSHCPFKAFATHRLGAVELDEPEPGLSAKGRGTLTHLALKYFWEDLKSFERLKGLKESGGLREFAEKIAERAIVKVDLPRPFSTRFLEIEKERLIAVLLDWVENELARTPFVVKRVEDKEEMDISGLRIGGTIDRVDELEGGESVIIDYKSGKMSAKDWLGERPRDPQMLIYSTSGRFDAVSFALISPGECRFVGISKSGSTLPGVSAYEKGEVEGADDWESLMELWRGVVSGLASDFLAGYAAVDPLGGADRTYGVCRYCGLRAFCRVGAMGDAAEDGQAGEEAEDE